ncbi:MAG: hypothetical protein GY898_18890 [Proteobacteria bacterium]|nr:hypothetical protein [Pseudomonadota bacterium]
MGNLIAPFIDGELDEAECLAIADHLEQCDTCAETVEAVAGLPDFERVSVDPEVESQLFEAFDTCLAQRIAHSLLSEDDEELAPTGTFGTLIRRELKVPVALVAAYTGVVLLLGGGILLNYQRVDDLQTAVSERDAIIDTMRVRLADAEAGPNDSFLAAETGADTPNIVFLPAGTNGTGLPAAAGTTVMPASFQLGPANGTAWRNAALESPRVVH